MNVKNINNISFGKKPSDMTDYTNVLNKARTIAGNKGKSTLIIHSASLPDKTGVGRLNSTESLEFFEFAKNMWGINEIQLLPTGQFHEYNGTYPIYSGTSMDLGNHMIDIKSHISEADYKNLPKNGSGIDYKDVVLPNSAQEKALRKLYDNMTPETRTDFEKYKSSKPEFLEKKALYRVLREMNGSYDYKKWNETDKNLFNTDIINSERREKRIKEIHSYKQKEIDFYKFKQFLADSDLKKAKEKLNYKGLKLSGDLICGFSYDEVWANPKAFQEGKTIGWGLPALNFETPEAEKLLREKVRLYAERFDGFRVDASWTYVKQRGGRDYGSKILDIIDDEAKKVKGADYDLKNITHEFAASADDFNPFEGSKLKPYLKDRVKIYTSDVISDNWGTNEAFQHGQGWAPDSFILGATNHDSAEIKVNENQAEILGKILKIPSKKLITAKEFIKAKLAEPMAAFNNMIYIREALGVKEDYKTFKISKDYEKMYFDKLEQGEGFNPMDALEKTFKAKGLDKTEPELYKKIIEYRRILERKQSAPILKYVSIVLAAGVAVAACIALYINRKHLSQPNV